MAGLYIKGARLPDACWNCGWDPCELWNEERGDEPKHSDCPLVEVPDHGDLIDRDELLEKGGLCISDFGTPDEKWRPDRDWYLGINAVPTVIPADKEDI